MDDAQERRRKYGWPQVVLLSVLRGRHLEVEVVEVVGFSRKRVRMSELLCDGGNVSLHVWRPRIVILKKTGYFGHFCAKFIELVSVSKNVTLLQFCV